MIIAVISGKGGVGKTTIVANLGATLSLFGKKVLLVDLNISTPNLGLYFGSLFQERSIQKAMEGEIELKDCVISYKPNLHLIVADFNNEDCNLDFLRESLETLQSYDFIFLDGAAGIGREVKGTMSKVCVRLFVIGILSLSTLGCLSSSPRLRTSEIQSNITIEGDRVCMDEDDYNFLYEWASRGVDCE